MGDISKNFSRYEFTCKDKCGFDTVDVELIPVLQDVRDHFNAAILITSGCRCKRYNTAIHGAKKSKHMEGRAADIQVAGISPSEVQAYLISKYKGRFGIGAYSNFTHIDTRRGPARWGQS